MKSRHALFVRRVRASDVNGQKRSKMRDCSSIKQVGRNPAIELYRVLLMFLIVFDHTIEHGIWRQSGGEGVYVAPLIANIFMAFIIWHVDGFLSITGWFGTRFTLSKFLKLWGLITVYSVASVIHGCIVYGKFSASYLAGGWFGGTYLYFLFLTPLLNAALEFLAHDKRKLYLAWVILDSGVFLNWAPYQLMSGVAGYGAGSYSVMTFIVVYSNVRMLRMSGLVESISKRTVQRMMLIFAVAVVFLAATGAILNMIVQRAGWSWIDYFKAFGCYGGYNAPHVILMALAGLLLFAKFVRIPQWIADVVTRISPLMFGVYVIHDTTTFGRLIYRIPQTWMAENLGWHPIFIIFLTAIGCFALCIMVEGLRRILVGPFVRWIMPKIQAIDHRIGL